MLRQRPRCKDRRHKVKIRDPKTPTTTTYRTQARERRVPSKVTTKHELLRLKLQMISRKLGPDNPNANRHTGRERRVPSKSATKHELLPAAVETSITPRKKRERKLHPRPRSVSYSCHTPKPPLWNAYLVLVQAKPLPAFFLFIFLLPAAICLR